ncbi:hypothetical protein B0H63DRAFT_529322 [Podospora didyma]|uniref:Uncharacterized protein n=1 Tax=Podospora didyma TaxID=330526 RepID=A0AAE0K1E6_9PEZI|nr:hypothetical protein B0H63DRAFT_529322 [Podospora didyma]
MVLAVLVWFRDLVRYDLDHAIERVPVASGELSGYFRPANTSKSAKGDQWISASQSENERPPISDLLLCSIMSFCDGMELIFHDPSFPAIRACIFDMDGLLINSEDMITASLNTLLDKYGRPALPRSVRAQMMGVPNSSNGDVFHTGRWWQGERQRLTSGTRSR